MSSISPPEAHRQAPLDPEAFAARLDRLPPRGMSARVIAVTAAAYFFDLYDQSAFGIVAPAVRNSEGFSLNNIASLVSLTFIGMLLGGLFGGRLADRFGRIPLLALGLFLASVGSLAHTIPTGGLYSFGVFRLITALGMGTIFVVAVTYITEMSPSHKRGSRVALTFLFGGIGGALVAVVGRTVIPMGDESWRWVFAIGGLGLVLLALLFRLPESPLWLLSQGRTEDAERALVKFEQGVEKAVGTLPAPKENEAVSAVAKVEQATDGGGWRNAFRGSVLKSTVLLMAIWVVFSTITQVFSVWMTTILGLRGFDSETVLSIAAFGLFGAPIGMLFATFFADRFPRKLQLFTVAVVAGVAGMAFGVVTAAAVVAAAVFAHFFLMAWFSPVLNAAMMDQYPSALRSTGAGVAYSTGRFWSILFPFTLAAALSSFGAGIVGWVLLGCWLLIALLGLGLRADPNSR